jgi:hypothetical protein
VAATTQGYLKCNVDASFFDRVDAIGWGGAYEMITVYLFWQVLMSFKLDSPRSKEKL